MAIEFVTGKCSVFAPTARSEKSRKVLKAMRRTSFEIDEQLVLVNSTSTTIIASMMKLSQLSLQFEAKNFAAPEKKMSRWNFSFTAILSSFFCVNCSEDLNDEYAMCSCGSGNTVKVCGNHK